LVKYNRSVKGADKILLELKENNLDDGQGTLEKLLLHVGKK